MKCVVLLWYRMIIRLFPKSLEWEAPWLSPYRKNESKRAYFKHSNLAIASYNYLKKHCQHGLQSGDYHKIQHTFSPLGLKIGMKVCKAIKKMDALPACVISNSGLVDGHYILFFKKQIGGLRCTFELHFHKTRLFLYQVSLYEKKQELKKNAVDLTELLLGTSSSEEDTQHYQDNQGQSICAVNDFFYTHFIVTDPNSSSLNQLLAAKYRGAVKDYEEIYKSTFLETSMQA